MGSFSKRFSLFIVYLLQLGLIQTAKALDPHKQITQYDIRVYKARDGLQLLSIPQYLDFLEDSTPYEPWRFEADYCALMSDAAETPFDDHLAQIQVPVPNVAAAGGMGELSIYGTTLLGSSDVSHLIVRINAASPVEEFGHIDLYMANKAPILVWEPILKWIRSHSGGPAYLAKYD